MEGIPIKFHWKGKTFSTILLPDESHLVNREVKLSELFPLGSEMWSILSMCGLDPESYVEVEYDGERQEEQMSLAE